MMDKEISCSICHKSITIKLLKNLYRFGKVFEVHFCDFCKVGYTVPALSAEDISSLYAGYRSGSGKRFNPLVEYVIYLFRLSRRNEIKRFVKKGRLLDIGCGRGLFLHVMAQDGWETVGTEFDEITAKASSSLYNVKVVSDYGGLAAGSFDVITANHVLEHIDDPVGIIKKCRALLRKGGYIYIAVPNISSLQAVTGKGLWFHLDPPYHLNHFTPEGLCKLLTDNSFRIVKVDHFSMEYNPYGWFQTVLNISFGNVNALYGALKGSCSSADDCSKATLLQKILTLILLPVYIPLSFVLSLIESYLFKQGGTFGVFAVKEDA